MRSNVTEAGDGMPGSLAWRQRAGQIVLVQGLELAAEQPGDGAWMESAV
jgi:hypothetical protein